MNQEKFSLCDMFLSIQGEATFSGRPMLFLRFWGCPLSCPWCDEPLHKDPKSRREMNIAEIVAKMNQLAPDIPAVLLTGGEPLAVKNLPLLIAELKNRGKWLAMESSGSGGEIPSGLDWLTISPKQTIAADKMLAADELKFIVPANPTARQRQEITGWAAKHPNVWLQPCADGQQPNKKATATALKMVLASKGRLRLSCQIHKYLQIP